MSNIEPSNVPDDDRGLETGNLKALPGLPVLPPRNALIELAIFFAIIIGLEFGFDSLPDLNELEPHPFWLPVLLLSLQYGTVSGLLAAGVSILFTAFMGWPEQDIGENHFNYLIRIWAEPVLWIAAALVLGQFRMRQISERRALHRNVYELQAQRTAIAAYSTNLRLRCDELERQIAGRRDPSAKIVLNALAFLGQSDAQEFQSGFGAALEAVLGPGRYSLFVLHDQTLELAVAWGWDADADERTSFALAEPLAQRLVHERKGLSVLDEAGEAILDGQGYAAVPVRSSSSDRILGIVKVEDMPADRFDAAILQHLELVGAQVSPYLELHDAGAGAGAVAADRGEPAQSPETRPRQWQKLRWEARGPAANTRSGASGVKGAHGESEPVTRLRKPKIVR